jgi:hypothetical protein
MMPVCTGLGAWPKTAEAATNATVLIDMTFIEHLRVLLSNPLTIEKLLEMGPL